MLSYTPASELLNKIVLAARDLQIKESQISEILLYIKPEFDSAHITEYLYGNF